MINQLVWIKELLIDHREVLRTHWEDISDDAICEIKISYQEQINRFGYLMSLDGPREEYFDVLTGLLKQAEWLEEYIQETEVNVQTYDDYMEEFGDKDANEMNNILSRIDMNDFLNHAVETGELDFTLFKEVKIDPDGEKE